MQTKIEQDQINSDQKAHTGDEQTPPTAAAQTTEGKQFLHPVPAYLQARLQALLSIVQVEAEGQVVEPDGFRLKNLQAWAFEKHNTVFDSLGSLSGFCNLNCRFCYEEGNPLPYEQKILSPQEAETRISYYRHDCRKGLPLFRMNLYKEPFTNKNLVKILQMVRAADPEAELHLTTNGSLLNEEVLEQLRQLVPVNLCISLNSSDPEGRKSLMGDQHSERTIKLIQKLKYYGLPFVGSIVAWPDLDRQQLQETIRYLDDNLARSIRITLPGYSRFFSGKPPFDSKEVWDSLVADILPLRQQLKTPIMLLPSLYHAQALLPEVAGVIKQSPAEQAGIQFGDIIIRINDEAVLDRTSAQAMLTNLAQSSGVRMTLERAGSLYAVILQEQPDDVYTYPYRPAGYPASRAHPHGLVLIDDFDQNWLWEVLKRIAARRAKHVLIMTSAIMEPVVAGLLAAVPELDNYLGDTNLYLWVPQHRFWGGNIILGDLYTCSDYLQAVADFQDRQGLKPDLIVIPSSFSPNNNTDLLGISYSSIEHATGIPVELARCIHITV